MLNAHNRAASRRLAPALRDDRVVACFGGVLRCAHVMVGVDVEGDVSENLTEYVEPVYGAGDMKVAGEGRGIDDCERRVDVESDLTAYDAGQANELTCSSADRDVVFDVPLDVQAGDVLGFYF